jgi:HD-GYP domain-containing protein (c-di-GMP phosphodiesterase class II)
MLVLGQVDGLDMRSASGALRTSAVWVIPAAVLLTLASIVAMTTLQDRVTSSYDARVELGQVQRAFDSLQSVPYDVVGSAGPAADARVVARMQASEARIDASLASLRADALTPHLDEVVGPYHANFAVLERIRSLLVRGQSGAADALGPVAGRLQARVNHELALAEADISVRAADSQRLATYGSAAVIVFMVTLFILFYVRERRAHGLAQRLTRERAQLLLQDSQLLVIQRLAVAAEYRDDDTGQHTRRVGRLSVQIAACLEMPEEQRVLLGQAAPLHDVGKIAIPDRILLKRGRLTSAEFGRMKAHTTVGAGMLAGRNFPLLEMAEEIALSHHERWDGSGYPAGIAGAAIPLVGRIVAVADVFDALTHTRPYKDAWSVPDAIAEISRQRGHMFDPQVVDAFLRVLPRVLADIDGEPGDYRADTALVALRAA